MTNSESLLIINRGEIACRIIRTCRKLGITTHALYSYADRHSLHVCSADVAHPLDASDSYIDVDAIIKITKRIKPTYVHPGYGFLSENPILADAIANTSSVFVGPSAKVMRLMGDKVHARALATSLNIPIVPGKEIVTGDTSSFLSHIKTIGFPLLIKASMGGGGRGMRKVFSDADLHESIESASREANALFGSPSVFIEKLIEQPRHVEVQVIRDSHGFTSILGDRDCSMQRSHQKVLEEAPIPFISVEIRNLLHQYARLLFESSQYVGVGTAEFLLAPNGEVFFLEVNSRIQVEHPVTEAVCNHDIVELQIAVARGEALSTTIPSAVHPTCHAIEARLCAEQPDKNFQASTGTILRFDLHGDRVDTGFTVGSHVSPLYDSLLAKVICTGVTREESLVSLSHALSRCEVAGVYTNVNLLKKIVASKEFFTGDFSTSTLEEIRGSSGLDSHTLADALVSFIAHTIQYTEEHRSLLFWTSEVMPRWFHTRYDINGTPCDVSIHPESHAQQIAISVALPEQDKIIQRTLTYARLDYVAETCHPLALDWFEIHGETYRITKRATSLSSDGTTTSSLNDLIQAHLPGKVTALHVKVGDIVQRGSILLALESMKMEHPIVAPQSCKVTRVNVCAGEYVVVGTTLVEVTPTQA